MDGVSACPFCGGSNQRVKSSGRWGWFVSCSCAAVGPSANSRDEAIEAWNTRSEPTQSSLFDPQLAEDNERMFQANVEKNNRILHLMGENAKLRELVARVERARRDLCDAYPDAEMLNCEECPAWSACKGDLMDRMRELGVEVDG